MKNRGGYEWHRLLFELPGSVFTMENVVDGGNDCRILVGPELMLHMREEIEGSHREALLLESCDHRHVMRQLRPPLPLPPSTKIFKNDDDAQRCYNKYTAVYFLTGSPNTFHRMLHNYMYNVWYRPHSNPRIEYDEFIATFIYPLPVDSGAPESKTPYLDGPVGCRGLPWSYEDSQKIRELLDQTAFLHGSLSTEAQALVDKKKLDAKVRWDENQKLNSTASGQMSPTDLEEGLFSWEHLSNFHVQALFKAIIIVVADAEAKVYRHNVAGFPVYLVRTGNEEGLSEPISFESLYIQGDVMETDWYDGPETTAVATSLAAATNFILRLQERERCSFGECALPKQSPESWERNRDRMGVAVTGKSHGGEYTGSMDAFTSDSSTWVDPTVYPHMGSIATEIQALEDAAALDYCEIQDREEQKKQEEEEKAKQIREAAVKQAAAHRSTRVRTHRGDS